MSAQLSGQPLQHVILGPPPAALFGDGPQHTPLFLLESQLVGHPSSVNNYAFSDFICWMTYRAGQIHVHTSEIDIPPDLIPQLKELSSETDPWLAIKRFRKIFTGFVCGYLSYDLKNVREQLYSQNPDPVGLPDMWMGFPRLVWVFEQPISSDVLDGSYTVQQLHPTIPKSAYLQAIRTAQQRIHEGDYYEINLSHQLQARFSGNARALYRDMRRRGPVPYAAYMRLPVTESDAQVISPSSVRSSGSSDPNRDFAHTFESKPKHTSHSIVHICCASPERFLQKSAHRLTSDPIKGTRPRGATSAEDETIKAELFDSEKERAENLMIVDLVRNDLNRICVPGSVGVEQLFEIQSFGTVHQMVSRVAGILRDNMAPEEALASCFPMGSMTGAPKIRAMEDIERLESYRRGLYSGSVGFFTPEGDFNFNVVIRTAIIRQGKLYYSVGGAITADSDPEAEWQETLVKARALGTDIVE